MNSADSLSERLIAVESVVAHLQHDVEQLNSVILRQQTEIDALKRTVDHLESRIDETDAPPETRNAEEERPPHY
jgi:SlyX protein